MRGRRGARRLGVDDEMRLCALLLLFVASSLLDFLYSFCLTDYWSYINLIEMESKPLIIYQELLSQVYLPLA